MSKQTLDSKEKYPWLNRVLGSLFNKITGAGMTGAEMQAHDLNVAETMRQERRQEDFYNQYQSIGAQVRQMEEAGINPAVAAGGLQAPSSVSGPSYSGASAAPGADPIQVVLSTISGIRALKQQNLDMELARNEDTRKKEAHEVGVEKTRAEIRNLNARSAYQEFENLHQEELYNLDVDERNARIDQIFASIDEAEANTALTRVNTDIATLEKQYQEYANALAQLDVKYREPLLQAQLALSRAQENHIRYKEELSDARLLLDNANSESDRALTEQRVKLLEQQTKIAEEEAKVAGDMCQARLKQAEGDATYSKNKTALSYIGEVAKDIGIIVASTRVGGFSGKAGKAAVKASSVINHAHYRKNGR